MPPTRVLIVDDAVVIRRMLADVLSSDPALTVAGSAANGRIALAMIPQFNPDILILDVEMPEMDGLQTLAEVRKLYPFLPVIMFSTVTQRGAAATLDALSLGANDYVTKPANVGGAAQAIERIRQELIPKIKLFCQPMAALAASKLPRPAVALQNLANNMSIDPRRQEIIGAVAIGISTGGPNALAEVIPVIPRNFPVPVFIVQHMPPIFTKLLAHRLNARAQIETAEATPNSKVMPGNAYIAPGDYHMVVSREGRDVIIKTTQEPPENSCRPAVDVLFRSIAKTYGARALAVIMTGMGQDGLRGCMEIREQGGRILAQDEKTSVVWGMPGFVVNAGLAETVVPLEGIGPEIVRKVQEQRAFSVGLRT
jgi:two-component system, chemotaxis family, protein-glutamate methylesterase/glutaminase